MNFLCILFHLILNTNNAVNVIRALYSNTVFLSVFAGFYCRTCLEVPRDAIVRWSIFAVGLPDIWSWVTLTLNKWKLCYNIIDYKRLLLERKDINSGFKLKKWRHFVVIRRYNWHLTTTKINNTGWFTYHTRFITIVRLLLEIQMWEGGTFFSPPRLTKSEKAQTK